MAQLLSNTTKPNHQDYLLQCFKNADEIYMASAFLKKSGLTSLLPAITKHVASNKFIQIITGQNFGLTDPNALRVLHNLFKNKPNASVYLDKAEDKKKVFHPKLFLFKHANQGIIISGSANITNGGLKQNEEFSVCIKISTSSNEWKQALAYFEQITDAARADSVSLVVINRYEQFHAEQEKIRTEQKSVPDKKSSEYSFDYTKLEERLKEYRNTNYNEKLNERVKNYKKAKTYLDEIADTQKLTQQRFKEIVDELVGKKGQSGLWHSGSLLRLRKYVYQCKSEFRQLVKFIKDNQEFVAGKVFNRAKELVNKVEGAKINYVAEIMMTYQPERFANLNSNPIKVLNEEAGVYYKSHSSSYNGEDYEDYCNVILEICQKLNLKNMLEADSFFNDIYWKLKEEGTV